jgi:hypothetical protein
MACIICKKAVKLLLHGMIVLLWSVSVLRYELVFLGFFLVGLGFWLIVATGKVLLKQKSS